MKEENIAELPFDSFKKFQEFFERTHKIEDKLDLVTQYMSNILNQSERSSIKAFWNAKKLCAPLFKEKLRPIQRNYFWKKYIQLSKEGQRLQETLDEQANFSIEQVELALTVLEKELGQYDVFIQHIPPIVLPKGSKELLKKETDYLSFQKQLQFLKICISRLDGLRKEILETDMRIGHKNRILKRFSALGDLIFPKRKELIKKISDQFILDVETFFQKRLTEEKELFLVPYYVILNEIKTFQALAKILNLNIQSFTKTRKILSECWEKVTKQEKENKKKNKMKLKEQRKLFDEFFVKVKDFTNSSIEDDSLDSATVLDQTNIIEREICKASLSKSEITILCNQIQEFRINKINKIKEVSKKIDKEEKIKVQNLKDELSAIIEKKVNSSLNDLKEKEKVFKNSYEKFSLNKIDIHIFESKFYNLRSFILDQTSLKTFTKKQLEALFDEREALYQEVKLQLEIYRKEMGGLSLDFEKAMTYRELYDGAKIHLEKEMEALQNLEEKLNVTN